MCSGKAADNNGSCTDDDSFVRHRIHCPEQDRECPLG